MVAEDKKHKCDIKYLCLKRKEFPEKNEVIFQIVFRLHIISSVSITFVKSTKHFECNKSNTKQ